MRWALWLLSLPLIAQTVTVSQAPGSVFVATFGAKLPVAVYSAVVCSPPGVTVTGTWGEVRQIAEQGGINIVDNVLVAPTAQLAQSKTTLHKILIALEYAGLATTVIGVFHGAPAWLVESGSGLSGVSVALQQPVSQSETQAQQTITNALTNLYDPTAQFTLAGGCTPSKLLLGQAILNFKPISVPLPQPPQLKTVKVVSPYEVPDPTLWSQLWK